jgi:hypothetical protein
VGVSNELAVAAPQRAMISVEERGLVIRSFEDLQRFAKMVLEANAAPKGIDTIGKVSVAIQMGMERGLPPLGGLRMVYFVNGLPSWRGEAAVALVRQSGLCLSYRAFVDGEGEARRGVCVTHRQGDPNPVRTEFSVKDAMKAGLWKKDGPWQSYPDRQLKWRAIGFNLKDQFPDVLGGFPIAEEALDIPAAKGEAEPDRPALAAPPSGPDPLLAQLAAAPAPAVPLALDVPAAIAIAAVPVEVVAGVAAAPQEPTPPAMVRCKKHHDVDLVEADGCWKCEAEAKELAEAQVDGAREPLTLADLELVPTGAEARRRKK